MLYSYVMYYKIHIPEWLHINYECPNMYYKLRLTVLILAQPVFTTLWARVDRWFLNFQKKEGPLYFFHTDAMT